MLNIQGFARISLEAESSFRGMQLSLAVAQCQYAFESTFL